MWSYEIAPITSERKTDNHESIRHLGKTSKSVCNARDVKQGTRKHHLAHQSCAAKRNHSPTTHAHHHCVLVAIFACRALSMELRHFNTCSGSLTICSTARGFALLLSMIFSTSMIGRFRNKKRRYSASGLVFEVLHVLASPRTVLLIQLHHVTCPCMRRNSLP